jgi:hypothetical protein
MVLDGERHRLQVLAEVLEGRGLVAGNTRHVSMIGQPAPGRQRVMSQSFGAPALIHAVTVWMSAAAMQGAVLHPFGMRIVH